MKQLSVLVPVYNEAPILPELLLRLDATLSKQNIDYEVIAIDDRSSDGSLEVLRILSKKFPLKAFSKKGVQGKAYSIIEASLQAEAEIVCMIDADLQYPPEAIPQMLGMMKDNGVVVARRTTYDGSLLRRAGSRAMAFVLGKLLLGINADVQSGLKVFRKEFLSYLPSEELSPWSLDMPLLHAAVELGYQIGEVSIIFEKRAFGESKLSLLKPTLDITQSALKLRFQSKPPEAIKPSNGSMLGAGFVHRRKRFITHTTLHHQHSALRTFTTSQRNLILATFALVIGGFLINTLTTAIVVVGILSFVYFVDVMFNFYLILKSLHSPPEIRSTNEEIAQLKNSELPTYSVLCPLYKEAHIIPGFLAAIKAMDWPKEKLDVMLLFEEDDQESIDAVKHMELPSFVRVVVVPDSKPKTKPKACNYGLAFAKGEYVVIYDAEDIPDPQQLKKAYLAFQVVGPNIKCLQAKLNYYNPHQNWLTRFFTAEYSLWFDVILTGLQSIQTTIPLGGTSNHFRRQDLLDLEGWDPFNVTEDCDLGIRLFKRGFKTAIIDSTTMEEANSNVKNWIRQRSRWIKGYMQTYLIHMRNPIDFASKQGIHALVFQLTVGGKLAFILINPLLWVLTIAYFTLYAFVGPTIEAVYPSIVFYMAVTSLIFGNFMYLYYYMIGLAKREQWTLLKWVFLIPIYWLMVSVAGAIALYQLIVKPHYWEKTIHGLHLKKELVKKEVDKTSKGVLATVLAEVVHQEKVVTQSQLFPSSVTQLKSFARFQTIIKYRREWKQTLNHVLYGKYRGGTLLVLAMVLANFMNMATNFYLGRELNLQDFALFNTYLSLMNIFSIFLTALSTTVNQRAATILGKNDEKSAKNLWSYVKNRVFFASILLTVAWLLLLPWLSGFLNFHSMVPLFLFSPIILVGGVGAVNAGYLRGSLSFDLIAITTVAQPLVRLLLSIVFGSSPADHFAYLSIPGGFIVAVVISYVFARKGKDIPIAHKELRLPKTFFLLALVSNLSSIAFFSLDNIFVAHYLSVEATGLYGIMGLLGKIIFFAGSLITGFILPITAFREGKGLSSDSIFRNLLALATLLSTAAYLVFGLGVPLLAADYFGDKINAVRTLLPIYSLGILFYTISQAIVQFHLPKKHYSFAVLSFFIAVAQVVGLMFFHSSLTEIVIVMTVSGIANLVLLSLLHKYYKKLLLPLQNLNDFKDLFFDKILSPAQAPTQTMSKDSYRILIFNWRDLRHVWAGGAEVYIHEVAKQLIAQGHKVTLFCGNDGKNPRNEVIDGVQIVRRGGFYTVYVWAFLYYVLKFRNIFDVIIDSENGIPFLTPLFAKRPIFLLIHHVHQEVFRTQLRFPLSEVASIIEGDLMTFLYRKHHILTVSESSKGEILDLGLGKKEIIEVINPGISVGVFKPGKKTTYPSLIYIGRLKPYKNIDVAVKAFAKVKASHPDARFTIAGSGESLESLKRLAKELELEESVTFIQKFDDAEKAKLFASHWLAVQPSMTEGWGITVIEANASGTPVVASNVKGLKDSVVHEKTGLLVELNNVDAFAEAIMLLFKNKRLRDIMSRTALKWSENFSWEVSTQQLLKIIDKSFNTAEGLVDSKLYKVSKQSAQYEN